MCPQALPQGLLFLHLFHKPTVLLCMFLRLCYLGVTASLSLNRWYFIKLKNITRQLAWSEKKIHVVLSIMEERPFLQMPNRARSPSQHELRVLFPVLTRESVENRRQISLVHLQNAAQSKRTSFLLVEMEQADFSWPWMITPEMWVEEQRCLLLQETTRNSFLYSIVFRRITWKTNNSMNFPAIETKQKFLISESCRITAGDSFHPPALNAPVLSWSTKVASLATRVLRRKTINSW